MEADPEGKVYRLHFPGSAFAGKRRLGNGLPNVQRAVRFLTEYFSGKKPLTPLDWILKEGTLFQQKTWKALRAIPYGETRSYAWVAAQIGRPRAVRAVGNACGKNPLPIWIPCHRVVGSGGKLGGFSSGLQWKKRLLDLEKRPLHAKI